MTWKPLSFHALILLAVAVLLCSAATAQPGGRQYGGQGGDGMDKGPLPMDKFLIKAEGQYDFAIRRAQQLKGHPEIALEIQKTKEAFDANKSKYLKTPPYQPWELDYIKDTVNNHINEVQKMVVTVQDACDKGASADQIKTLVASIKVEAQSNQVRIESLSRAASLSAPPIIGLNNIPAALDHAAVERGLGDHMSPGGIHEAGQIHGGPPDAQEGDNAWENHKGKDFDSSEVVKLQQYAMQVAGQNAPGGTPSNGGNGGGGKGTGSSPSGAGTQSGTTPGSFNDKIGDLTQSAAAQALTSAGANALNDGHFSAALTNAQTALALDPGNQAALMILHSAQGRVEGGGSSAGAMAGGGAGERGFAGGGADGGRATFASAGRETAALASAAGASRMSGEQAMKAAQNALKLGDNEAALAAANRLIGMNPNDPVALAMRAKIYAQMGDYAKAIIDAKAGLANSPKDKALLQTLGYSQLRSKDYKGAFASAGEMLELEPNSAFAYALRGGASGAMGDRDAMMSDLKRAAEINPSYRASYDQAQLQLPADSDILFLFPGESARGQAANTAVRSGGRARNFGVVAGAAALGGLLLAIGLLQTVLAPLKEQVSSVFTRITRTGPSVASMPAESTPQPASVSGLMPGLIRGQYEITRQIGQGGMGTVYEGTDKSLGRRVAIKKMRDELRVNPQERARFVIEAKTVAALHHPNVVDIYAIAEDGQDVFLIFEYVDGKTVHDMVQHAGRLSVAEAARITRASADALTYAHSRGVIHRDMKPSNVMLDAQNRVKVMDFGIARMAKDSATRYSMTNTVVGTPPYMAPEQEQGQVRKESDVYALGICAYEMLTGKLPFIGIGAGMLMNKINMSYVPPSRAIAGLPEALDEVFAKAFQADPDKRFRTPAEFADALESALPAGVRA